MEGSRRIGRVGILWEKSSPKYNIRMESGRYNTVWLNFLPKWSNLRDVGRLSTSWLSLSPNMRVARVGRWSTGVLKWYK